MIVIAEVLAKVVVDPAAMAANRVPTRSKGTNPFLRLRIVLHIHALAVVELVYVRACGEVQRKRPLIQDAGFIQQGNALQ